MSESKCDNDYLNYVEQQKDWHDKKSLANKRWYTALIVIDIILSSSIMLSLSFYGFNPTLMRIIISILAFMTTLASSFIAAFPLKSNWIRYRIISEGLKVEIWEFELKQGKYKNLENPLCTFLETCNRILQNEAMAFLDENKNTGRRQK